MFNGVIRVFCFLGVTFLLQACTNTSAPPIDSIVEPLTNTSASKTFARDGSKFKDLAIGYGACFITDKITIDGLPVGYMYRETPDNEIDSGWRFLAGDESDKYIDNPENTGVYDVNTAANYDPAVIPLLDSPIGSAYIKKDGELVPDIMPEIRP